MLDLPHPLPHEPMPRRPALLASHHGCSQALGKAARLALEDGDPGTRPYGESSVRPTFDKER